MSAHSLNDTCRFWFALAGNPDVIDDPDGLRHPLADRAARIGMSPGEFSEACRTFQKLRADQADKTSENCGIGRSLDFESLNSRNQFGCSIHQNSPQANNMTASEIMRLNAKSV